MTGWHLIPTWHDAVVILAVIVAVLVGYIAVVEMAVGLRALWRLVCRGAINVFHMVIGKVRSKKYEIENGAGQNMATGRDEKTAENAGRAKGRNDDVHRLLAVGRLDAQPTRAESRPTGTASAGTSTDPTTSKRTGHRAATPGAWDGRPPEGLSLHDSLVWRRDHGMG